MNPYESEPFHPRSLARLFTFCKIFLIMLAFPLLVVYLATLCHCALNVTIENDSEDAETHLQPIYGTQFALIPGQGWFSSVLAPTGESINPYHLSNPVTVTMSISSPQDGESTQSQLYWMTLLFNGKHYLVTFV